MHANDALKVEIERELEALKEMEVGSAQLGDAINDVTKLIDRKIEMDRIENEAYDKAEDRKTEQKNRLIGHIITGTVGVGTLLVSVWGFNKSMKFEEVGTITTQAGRAFLNRVLAKK